MSELPSGPYKGLAAFGDSALDALLFFGRERERETIVANVLASRLTVLFGPSGVGKSSLLRAGVAQRLRALGGGAVIVHGEWAVEPEAGVVAVGARRRPGARADGGPRRHGRCGGATQRRGVTSCSTSSRSTSSTTAPTARSAMRCPSCCAVPGCASTCCIALRDDALAELDAFAGRAAGALRRTCSRLDRLDRALALAPRSSARSSVRRACRRGYSAEPALVDALLDEVAAGRVDFGGVARAPASRELRRGAVSPARAGAAVGRGAGSWVARAAARDVRAARRRRADPPRPCLRHAGAAAAAEQDTVARLVRQLVTPSGAKTSHTAADLAEYTGVEPEELQSLLGTADAASASFASSRARPAGRRATRSSTTSSPSRCSPGEPATSSSANASMRGGSGGGCARSSPPRSSRSSIVGAVAVFALVQRSDARAQARRAHARELVGAGACRHLVESRCEPRPARCTPRCSLPERRRRTSCARACSRCASNASSGSAAASSTRALRRTAVACSSRAATARSASTTRNGRRIAKLPRQQRAHAVRPGARTAASFATGDADGTVTVWRASDGREVAAREHAGADLGRSRSPASGCSRRAAVTSGS